jgi:hypothetical protein
MAVIETRVITPRKFDDKRFEWVIREVTRAVAADVLRDYQKTVESWEHKPEFETIIDMKPNPTILVDTDDEVYSYVNDGTKPHPIKPKGQWPLRFQWGGKGSYKAKTRPAWIGSRPGGPSGPQVALKSVRHPGTNPRKFDEIIQHRWARLFPQRMQAALNGGAEASGHGMP